MDALDIALLLIEANRCFPETSLICGLARGDTDDIIGRKIMHGNASLAELEINTVVVEVEVQVVEFKPPFYNREGHPRRQG